ncbi:MAG: hypothetical protein V3W19_14980 [Desulfatiglandales bacterium]
MEIPVQIGEWSRTYLPHWTNAPAAYDGFGTLQLYDGKDKRLVLIVDHHVDWHIQRYGSGGYRAWPIDRPEDRVPDGYIEEKLIAKLNAPFKEEE